MFEASERIIFLKDWITILFIVIFILLTFVKLVYPKRIRLINIAFLSKKYILFFARESKSVIYGFSILMFILRILIFALMLYLLLIFFSTSYSEDLATFSKIVLIVAVYILGKNFLESMLGFVLGIKKEQEYFSFCKISYLNNFVLWILPFLLMIIYVERQQQLLVYVTMAISLLFLTLSFILTISHNKKSIFNDIFYFILYICTLEITPVIIMLKLAI